MIYVATPYTHPELYVRIQRYKAVLPILATLARRRVSCYSPIVHWHNVEVEHDLGPGDHEIWKWSDIDLMSLCTEGLFIKIDGWQTSRGMKHEEKWLFEQRKPVTWIFPDELENWLADYPAYGVRR